MSWYEEDDSGLALPDELAGIAENPEELLPDAPSRIKEDRLLIHSQLPP